MLNPGSFS